MAPPFSSQRQAWGFTLLVLMCLALPALVARTHWLRRDNVYSGVNCRAGAFTWIHKKIFTETNDVDIAFLGSSHIWSGVNSRYVQEQLSERLARNAEVFTLGWSWSGFDVPYLVASDLLKHRRVHLLVVYDERPDAKENHHEHLFRFLRWGECPEIVKNLPSLSKASLYGEAVMGMPRHLLGLARPNRLGEPSEEHANQYPPKTMCAADLKTYRGALRARAGIDRSSDNFQNYKLPKESRSVKALICSSETEKAFEFSRPELGPYQQAWVNGLVDLCGKVGTQLVMLHVPTMAEKKQTVVLEREYPPASSGGVVIFMGSPGKQIFEGVNAEDLPKLFYDEWHLNKTGQDLFTPIITKPLVDLYENLYPKR